MTTNKRQILFLPDLSIHRSALCLTVLRFVSVQGEHELFEAEMRHAQDRRQQEVLPQPKSLSPGPVLWKTLGDLHMAGPKGERNQESWLQGPCFPQLWCQWCHWGLRFPNLEKDWVKVPKVLSWSHISLIFVFVFVCFQRQTLLVWALTATKGTWVYRYCQYFPGLLSSRLACFLRGMDER